MKFPLKMVAQLPEETKLPNSIKDRTFWVMERDGITQGTLATFIQCPMKADHKFKEGLVPVNKGYNPYLSFGTLFHGILDSVYSQKMITPSSASDWELYCEGALEKWYKDTIAQGLDIKDEEQFERLWGMSATILPYYFRRWAKKDNAYRWIAVEEVFSFPYTLRDGTVVQVRGKWDGVVIDRNNDMWLFETKTMSDIDNISTDVSCKALVEKMAYELQVQVYCIAIHNRWGKWPKGVLYNMVKRPGQKYSGFFSKKAESLPQYFERIEADLNTKGDAYFCRYEISLDPEEITYFRDRDLDYWIERIYEWHFGGIASPRVSSQCAAYTTGPCEYLKLCSESDRSVYKQRGDIFPELVEITD